MTLLPFLISVPTHVALDDVGLLGQVQQHGVMGQEEVGVDAAVPGHAADGLRLLSLGDGHHVQRRVILGLDLFVVLFVFSLWEKNSSKQHSSWPKKLVVLKLESGQP